MATCVVQLDLGTEVEILNGSKMEDVLWTSNSAVIVLSLIGSSVNSKFFAVPVDFV